MVSINPVKIISKYPSNELIKIEFFKADEGIYSLDLKIEFYLSETLNFVWSSFCFLR